MSQVLTRRTFLKTSGLATAGLALPWYACTPTNRPDFTVAFLTDMHVRGKHDAPLGFAKALKSAMAQPIKPDFVILGGDLVYDSLHQNQEEVDVQFDLMKTALDENVDVPVHPVLGNHDCLGVYDDSGVDPDDPLFGRKYFLDRFRFDKTYRAFDHKGWSFGLMDTVNTDNRNYKGEVDAEQILWLDSVIERGNPTVLAGHIPFFSNYRESKDGGTNADHPKETVHNANLVTRSFEGKKVRMVLAGHLHINESWVYKGTEYANLGAVSGRWWHGPRDGCQEGYSMLEFYGDQVRWSYVDYGWEPSEEAKADNTW